VDRRPQPSPIFRAVHFSTRKPSKTDLTPISASAELGEVFARDLILALPPAEGDDVWALALGEVFDGGDKGPCHLRHRLGSSEAFAALVAQEKRDAAFHLEAWLDDV
jgi:hypothetical protein